MEFLFLPRSLRDYPGRGIACIACVLWSLRRGTHTQYTPNTHLILTQYSPNTHLNYMFYNISRNYFWIY